MGLPMQRIESCIRGLKSIEKERVLLCYHVNSSTNTEISDRKW